MDCLEQWLICCGGVDGREVLALAIAVDQERVVLPHVDDGLGPGDLAGDDFVVMPEEVLDALGVECSLQLGLDVLLVLS